MTKDNLNKWQFLFVWGDTAWSRREREFHFGLFKLTSLPPVGQSIGKENYKGFWIKKYWIKKNIEINKFFN